jgi:hypothetical protein
MEILAGYGKLLRPAKTLMIRTYGTTKEQSRKMFKKFVLVERGSSG